MKNCKFIIGAILIALILSCGNRGKKASTDEDDKRNNQMEQIVKLHDSGKWAEIIKQKEVLLKNSEKDAFSLLMLSEAYAQLENYERGIFYAEKIIERDPSNYYALLMLGNYYFILQSFDKAEKYYFKVLDIKPTYARANLNLAMLYVKLNKNYLAIPQYLQAIELFSANNFKEEVIQYSREVLKLDPYNQKAKQYIAKTPVN